MNYSPTESIYASKSNLLINKKIALCITGSISAIKSLDISRKLIRHGADVKAVMTEGAREIIHPYCMEYATGKKVITKISGLVEHIGIAGDHDKNYDLILVCPATSNTISKAANGVEDTPVTNIISTALGSNIPIAIVPAMHLSMYNNSIIQKNITKLKKVGCMFLSPTIEDKKAKLPKISDIVDFSISNICKKDFGEKKVLVTGGPTKVKIDQIRYITNPSSAKMGIALSKALYFRGAKVKFICGDTSEYIPKCLDVSKVETYDEMYETVFEQLKSGYDFFISAAAVSDFEVREHKDSKLDSKKEHLLKLIPTKKIISEVKKKYPNIKIVGFKAEYKSNKLFSHAYNSLIESDMDLIVANDVSLSNSGFRSDNNSAFVLDSKKNKNEISLCNKLEFSNKLLDIIIKRGFSK